MVKIVKVQLQGYLADMVRDTAERMNALEARFNGEALEKFATAARVATLASVTHAKIADAFAAVHYCRRVMAEALEQREREERERAERLERARQEREREEREAARRAAIVEAAAVSLPYMAIDETFLLERHNIGTDADKGQILRQLSDAPLFSNLSVSDIYIKRHALNYAMTDGADALTFAAVRFSDYMERFARQVRADVDAVFYEAWAGNENRHTWRAFFMDLGALRLGLLENRISAEHMQEIGARSPKFSKFLIQLLGEKSVSVRMFNDRPRADELEKETAERLEGYNVTISNIAANVMKMTAGNAFSSCQNYEASDADALQYLVALPSSVNDETLSIAYMAADDTNILHPFMNGRLLIKPFEYNGKLFIYAYNGYGKTKDIISTLRAAYGSRFIYEGDNYSGGDMFQYEHNYGYDVRVTVESEVNRYCYMCDGDGTVTAVVRWHDYEFETECPACEGSGENDEPDYEEEERFPYVNGWAVDYDYDSCTVTINRELLETAILTESGAELEALDAAI